MSNALSGRSSLSYQGTNAANPPNVIYSKNAPTQYDSQNFSLGDLWIDTDTNAAYMLVALIAGLATWALLGVSTSELEYLEGDSGGQISPNSAGIIFIKGDGTSITVQGNKSTNTLMVSLVSGSFVSSLTGNNSMTKVYPDSSGNINVVGDGTTINISGSGHTLTASVISSVALTFTGNNTSSPVSPSAGNINIVGDGTTIYISGNESDNTLTASIVSGGALDTLTGNIGGPISPDSSGNINIKGTAGIITVTGNNSTHTLTIDGGSEVATTYDADSGSATPSSNILTIVGGTNINTSATGSTVTVNLDSTLTGITNLTVANLTVTNAETLSFLGAGVVQTNSSGAITSTEGTDGQILIGSSTGAPAWATITAGTNVTVTNGHNSITIAASGSGGGSPGLVLLQSIDVTGMTTGTFTAFSSTYTSYMIVANKLIFPTLGGSGFNPLLMRVSTNGGSSYIATNYSYTINYNIYSSSALSNVNGNNTTSAAIGIYENGTTSPAQAVSFTAYLYDLPNTNFAKNFYTEGTLYDGTNLYSFFGSSVWFGPNTPAGGTPAVNAIQVTFPGTGMTGGTLQLYGFSH